MAGPEHLPKKSEMPGLCSYEDLLAAETGDYVWPSFDENTACSLCYTSGTTDQPKGVLYSHRSTLLHAFGISLPDALGCSALDVIMPVVPMFHVNAWGLPYAAPLNGAKLVLPGAGMDSASLFEMMENEGVTFSAGVPTIWLALLQFMREGQRRFSTLARTVVGGASCPPALMTAFEDELNVTVLHAWGMTETSPLGTGARLKAKHASLSPADSLAIRSKQGRAVFGIDMKIVGDDGHALPHDGAAFGDLLVRGPWVVRDYFRAATPGELTADGWFRTGDVATIDPDGYMHITDRSKDVIKSGGEWISSIDLANLAVAHPAVAEAAVIGVPSARWSERPLLIVVRRPGMELSAEEMLNFFRGRVAKFCEPDAVEFVESLPHTATGKLLKTQLRKDFAGYSVA